MKHESIPNKGDIKKKKRGQRKKTSNVKVKEEKPTYCFKNRLLLNSPYFIYIWTFYIPLKLITA